MHEYENISKSQGVSGAGIANNSLMLKKILEISPGADIPVGLSKHCFQKILCAHPDLNTTRFNMSTFAGLRVDRLGVVLCHLRRLCNEPERIPQCASKCTGAQFSIVQELVASCTSRETSADRSTTETIFVPPGRHGEAIPLPRVAVSPGRRLKRKVSVDDMGFPMFDSPPAKEKHSDPLVTPRTPRVSSRHVTSPITIPTPAEPLTSKGRRPPFGPLSAASLGHVDAPESQPKSKKPPRSTSKAERSKGESVPKKSPTVKKKDWAILYYKNNFSFGIRRKFGDKNQIWSFKSSKRPFTKELKAQLENLAKECVIKLLEGEGECDVHEWVLKAAADL